MGDKMSVVWNTKYGTRRVKQNPPTLVEAIAAARGLTDDRQQQIDFAADLTGLSAEEVVAEMVKTDPPKSRTVLTVSVPNRSGHAREVVVERRISRRRVM
jgi:hypothetical protein